MTSDGQRSTDGPSRPPSMGGNSNVAEDDAHDSTDHLADLADGSGCAEIWEHLSNTRYRESDETG